MQVQPNTTENRQAHGHPARRFMVTIDAAGNENVELLSHDAMVYQSVDHFLHALVSGDLGERVTQTLASQACLLMAAASAERFEATHAPAVRTTLASIEELSPAELHALATKSYQRLCAMTHQASEAAAGVTH